MVDDSYPPASKELPEAGQRSGPVPPADRSHGAPFSEIMRDVDMFVGVGSVGSVGNDSTWQDGGPHGQYHDYWTSYSFGDLSETAQTRQLLPFEGDQRLAIILSKAFLLADDKRITDTTITRQIGR